MKKYNLTMFVLFATLMMLVSPTHASEMDQEEGIDTVNLVNIDGELTGVIANALINSTEDASIVLGHVFLMETQNGIVVTGLINGQSLAGDHGIHIHENGSCDDNGKAAGGHYNPKGVEHGFLPKDGHDHAHAGDMGNITIDENGSGNLNVFLPMVKLSGDKYNVTEKAIILHAKNDDFGQPTGNAGARIGCGIITLGNN